MARYRGTERDDDYRGTRSADVILGFGGNDRLHGGSGDDRIEGGAGHDALSGGLGNDRLDGGDGIDAVFYSDSTAGVVVNLATGRAQDGDGGTDRLSNIEVAFGSAYADRLIGGGGCDELHGGRGDDLLRGGAGDDLLFGDAGSDRIDGGAGADFVSYFNSAGAIDLDLQSGRAVDSARGVDTLRDIEGAYGSQLNDRLSGDGGNNLLVGNGGNDVLLGRGGNDTIDGGEGNDAIEGGSGVDTLWGGNGNDLFVFGPGSMGDTRATADAIADFGTASDTIDLSAIDADATTTADDAFAFIGTAAFSGTAGELRVEVGQGQTWLLADMDGDAVADGHIRLEGTHALTAADFFL